eukprot:CAMPEP_0201629890 /NCGR_PEP_ID=MMETSP0493-20130528/4397_1 /ASSEMBLY_ACC=CAM_ASM_000838 /TAXON_ID=420259 /ORGANISM="Thalassiosira gravida, Strain GMp14c1" /LENGTH=75 /DNA_ID=CAMNT_0048100959 /DNA_START=190 /DNA_END=417 /DNA_ORIENTATION=-
MARSVTLWPAKIGGSTATMCHTPDRPSSTATQLISDDAYAAYLVVWYRRHRYRACFQRRRWTTGAAGVDLDLVDP